MGVEGIVTERQGCLTCDPDPPAGYMVCNSLGVKIGVVTAILQARIEKGGNQIDPVISYFKLLCRIYQRVL